MHCPGVQLNKADDVVVTKKCKYMHQQHRSQKKTSIASFNNIVDDTLGKPNHYTIVMGDLNAQRTNPMETATGRFGLELRNERGDTLAEWAISRKYKIVNTMFQTKAGKRWTWKSPNSVMKTDIDYILTNRFDIVTDVTVIKQVNIGSDHRLVMSNIKLDVEVERKQLTDHIQVANQLKEKCIEYNIPLCIAFVDEKAIDSVQIKHY